MKIVTIVGARPQFIKAALISGRIRKAGRAGKKIREVLVNTGQHYDYNMSKNFFKELSIPSPDYDLNAGSSAPVDQITKMMRRIEPVLKKERPDAVLVYGDTNSTLAGALVAARLNIPLCHVEAGLRSYDKSMPEEINRVLTDHLSTILFCPTSQAVENLKKEGISNGVYLVGDIMYELALKMSEIALKRSDILRRLGLKRKGYVLATVHRESNTDIKSNLSAIINAFRGIKDIVVFPTHPRTRKMLSRFGLWQRVRETKNIKVIPPAGYLDMICLEKNAFKIITDSGGVQKEAYFFKVSCITLRDRTEWLETLWGGWNILSGASTNKIVKAYHRKKALKSHPDYYGDGRTSERILKVLNSRKV